MRSIRNESCLYWAALVRTLRAREFGVAALLTLLLLPAPACAQSRDPQQAALDDFVAARMLATTCPSWQLDPAEAQRRFAEVKLKPVDWQAPGRHSSFFDGRLSYYGSLLSRMSEMRACEMAEAAFGPAGRVRRGWMRRQ
jgi:hypothetical protein